MDRSRSYFDRPVDIPGKGQFWPQPVQDHIGMVQERGLDPRDFRDVNGTQRKMHNGYDSQLTGSSFAQTGFNPMLQQNEQQVRMARLADNLRRGRPQLLQPDKQPVDSITRLQPAQYAPQQNINPVSDGISMPGRNIETEEEMESAFYQHMYNTDSNMTNDEIGDALYDEKGMNWFYDRTFN